MKIIQTAVDLPQKIVTNLDLENMVDTSDEWIRQRTGIIERRIAVEETVSSMAVCVAQKLINESGISARDIGLIVVASMSSEHNSPSVAAQVQSEINAENAVCFDISAACSGFVYAISIVEKLTAYYKNKYAIVIGSEKMSNIIDWTDRSTCVLFGDGAGGVLVKEDQESIIAEEIKSDGSQSQAIIGGGNPTITPFMAEEEASFYLKMNGKEVYKFATKSVPKQIQTVLDRSNLTASEIDYFVLHQANKRIIEICQRKIGVEADKIPLNIHKFGNTSAASIPILLNELTKKGKIRLDGTQTILLSGFGGGLTWASLVIKV